MNLKLLISFLLVIVLPAFFSACAKIEVDKRQEVLLEDGASKEVYINDADIKDEYKPTRIKRQTPQPEKRILSDKSELVTMFDGFGNKTETRYFPGHPRIRFLILRTSVDGTQEVTVYGYGGETKVVTSLNYKALNASGNEIADIAQLSATRGNPENLSFWRKRKNAKQLEPLPSSTFEKSLTPVTQSPETPQPETSEDNGSLTTQQNESQEIQSTKESSATKDKLD